MSQYRHGDNGIAKCRDVAPASRSAALLNRVCGEDCEFECNVRMDRDPPCSIGGPGVIVCVSGISAAQFEAEGVLGLDLVESESRSFGSMLVVLSSNLS